MGPNFGSRTGQFQIFNELQPSNGDDMRWSQSRFFFASFRGQWYPTGGGHLLVRARELSWWEKLGWGSNIWTCCWSLRNWMRFLVNLSDLKCLKHVWTNLALRSPLWVTWVEPNLQLTVQGPSATVQAARLFALLSPLLRSSGTAPPSTPSEWVQLS